MGARRIDLNSDVGEGFGAWAGGPDDELLPLITSANVACGFHAGDPSTIRRTCAAAVAHGCAVGAQVSYPDLAGFGRRFMDMRPAELTDAVLYQIGAVDSLAGAVGGRVAYVKPHGALYNAIAEHEAQAGAVALALREHAGGLPLLGLPDSAIMRAAEREGVPFVTEGFADRAYTPAGRLVPRGTPGALLTDPAAAARQALDLVDRGVASICVHSDTPGAPAILAEVVRALSAAGVEPRSFLA